MEQEILSSIDKKLDAIIKLLAINFVEGKSKTEAILILGNFSLDSNMIADIVGTTPATVTARLWEQKKKSTTKTKVKKANKTKGAA